MNQEEIINEIKNIKIQGARNVTKALLKLFLLKVENFEGKKEELIKELTNITKDLLSVRPTEPMARSAIEDALTIFIGLLNMEASLDEIKVLFKNKLENYLAMLDKNKEKIAEIGANYLPNAARVITYCHSSTVEAILKKAYDLGKLKKVIACETRPLYQGHITAKNLADYGIDVTLIVDGAMASFAKHVDLALVGGDAVTITGDLINKIGTYSLAKVMSTYSKPFLSAIESYKFDPYSKLGSIIPIEERDPKEIWDINHKHITIRNPAFDRTDARYITSYITEHGIYPPAMIEEAYEASKKEFNALIKTL